MVEIPNPIRWFCAPDEDSEWWHNAGASRAEAIEVGKERYDGTPFWIAECRRMVPTFAIFDADDICERLSEDECWWEDGWTGEPDDAAKRDLEQRLAEAFATWFAEKASLDGASLDEIRSEKIAPSPTTDVDQVAK